MSGADLSRATRSKRGTLLAARPPRRIVDASNTPGSQSRAVARSAICRHHPIRNTWSGSLGRAVRRALDSGLVPSMGSIGDCYDNGQMESFWARMQVELLNRKRWNTRLELANASLRVP